MEKEMVTTGKLAQEFGCLRSTIEFYIREGLLKPDETSDGGFQMFCLEDGIKRLTKIKKLKEKRWTIAEIKAKLG